MTDEIALVRWHLVKRAEQMRGVKPRQHRNAIGDCRICSLSLRQHFRDAKQLTSKELFQRDDALFIQNIDGSRFDHIEFLRHLSHAEQGLAMEQSDFCTVMSHGLHQEPCLAALCDGCGD